MLFLKEGAVNHHVLMRRLIACIIQWNKVPETQYYIDPSYKGPSIEVGIATADADWNELDKEVDAFLDATDSDDQSSEGSLEGSALSDANLSDREKRSHGSNHENSAEEDDDDDWLHGEIEAELNEESEVAEIETRKRLFKDLEAEIIITTRKRAAKEKKV